MKGKSSVDPSKYSENEKLEFEGLLKVFSIVLGVNGG
jgi:hypothetical protein